MEEKELNLEEVYETLKQKNNLPELLELEEDFDIKKIEKEDEKFLIRSIRRVIGEKIGAYSQFLEILLNPSSPPLFLYSFLKNITPKQKEEIKKIYEILGKSQIEMMKLDTVYSEKEEIEFVKSFFISWQSLKKEIYSLITEVEKSSSKDLGINKRSYLG